ncbi:MAG: Fe-Mn family superoxide dismutase [Alphaproteobacteria bacterium]|jgi:Fe-Mn family superoxide dismutase|nr:Fe-Mn family superoxide dismutase [Alphaproteobacteria bacterium]
MLLHEVYFDGLGGADGLGSPAGEAPGDLAGALARDFGGVEGWRAEFVAMGKALAGGSGWVVLAWSARQGRLVNQWGADHAHALADGVPILALDMYEHAYHLDFGSDAAAYVDAFMKNIHWGRPADRFRQATGFAAGNSTSEEQPASVSPEALREQLDRHGDLLVLDVRPADFIFERHGTIPGASVRPPERLAEWADELPRDRPIVAYCVYGFQVSGDAVAELRRRGLDARILSGGIAAWNAIGAPTRPLDALVRKAAP